MSTRKKPILKSTKTAPQYKVGTPTAKIKSYGIKDDMRRIERVENTLARAGILEQRFERNQVSYFEKNLICFKDALEKSLIQDEESIMISTKIDPNITIGKHTEVIGLTDFKKRPNYLDFDIIHEIIKLAEITERKQNPSSSASTMNLLRVLNAYKAVFKQKGVSANIVCSYIYRLHPLKILFIIEY